MSDLTMTRVDEPGPMWRMFAAAAGDEEMRACYGWESPPACARWGERVYAFLDGTVTVAWASLARYPKEPNWFELALGVWPALRRRGYRRRVLGLCAAEAFALGAEHVSMLVLDSAAAHAAQCLREAGAGSEWAYAGRVWYPDAYRVFTVSRVGRAAKKVRDVWHFVPDRTVSRLAK